MQALSVAFETGTHHQCASGLAATFAVVCSLLPPLSHRSLFSPLRPSIVIISSLSLFCSNYRHSLTILPVAIHNRAQQIVLSLTIAHHQESSHSTLFSRPIQFSDLIEQYELSCRKSGPTRLAKKSEHIYYIETPL